MRQFLVPNSDEIVKNLKVLLSSILN